MWQQVLRALPVAGKLGFLAAGWKVEGPAVSVGPSRGRGNSFKWQDTGTGRVVTSQKKHQGVALAS